MALDQKKLSDLLTSKSPLAKKLDRFQERSEQQSMLEAILSVYNDHGFAIIEAGTGVGKSLAYLLPAIYAAHELSERTVISTHTITLQEQLVQKDIPFILDTLGLDVNVALVKGMGNYLCLRKLYDLLDNASLLNVSEREDLAEIEEWAKNTDDGSTSSLEKAPKNLHWEKLNCESDACSFVKCPHYKECFFYNARKSVKDAKLLIANHNLLMVDLQARDGDENASILPEYEHLIVDEAHTLEDIATSALAGYVSSSYLARKLHELVSDRGSTGKLQQLKKKLTNAQDDLPPRLWDKISHTLFAEKKEVESYLLEAFSSLDQFLHNLGSKSGDALGSDKILLTKEILADEEWFSIKDHFVVLINKLKMLATSLDLTLEELSKEKLEKGLSNLFVDIKAISLYFEKSAALIWEYFNQTPTDEKLFVIDWNARKAHLGIQLSVIHLNISEILSEKLFYPLSSGVLTSATLNHSGHFKFVKTQLGLDKDFLKNENFVEKILPSPFDYKNQVLLAIPRDIPYPSAPNYLDQMCDQIAQALLSSKGGAFVLFTSFKMLKECYERLLPVLLGSDLLPLKQGDENRSVLLKLFKENANSVLFGTDTFWEGIDVPGFHLRQVIMTKLPFPVPSEPIFQARCKQVEARGQNPFMDYSVPKAIVKFKQGFGRLIRGDGDFGAILCLDSRLLTKSYGRVFLQSLPECQTAFGYSNQVQDQIKTFFEEKLVLQ